MNRKYFVCYFKLYAHCIPVKGYKRSVICDFGKSSLIYIPNSLYQILTEFNEMRIDDIVGSFSTDDEKEIIIDYFDYLIEKDLILLDEDKNELEKFPCLTLDWDIPNIITNCIIDVNTSNQISVYRTFIEQLGIVNCNYIQLRFFDFVPNEWLDELLQQFNQTKIRGIDLVIRYDDNKSMEFIKILQEKHMRIQKIIVHSSPNDNDLTTNATHSVIYCINTINSEACCGNIEPYYFSINDIHFRESLVFNTCLNRKVSIDRNGFIKNCPSIQENYGHISNTNLLEVIIKTEFQKYWHINKNLINVCKECEFRYICTDCRAYIENPDDIFSKPLKCGYNPYTSEWENWSTNPLKQNAIEYYGLKEIAVDKK